MTTTTFTNGSTLTDAGWFNDLDAFYYELFGSAGGLACIGDTVNAKSTIGLTINQGANDDEIVSLKSSDVAHGVTGITETDTYGALGKAIAASGGLNVKGLSEAGQGLLIQAIATTEDTTKSTSGAGNIELQAYLKSGSSVTDHGTDANLLVMRNSGTTRFIFDAEGDPHQDVGVAWVNFDSYNDVALLNATSALLHPDSLKTTFTQGFLQENKKRLQELKIVTFNDDGHHFINWSRFQMLHMGATRWLADQLNVAMQKIEKLEKRPLWRRLLGGWK